MEINTFWKNSFSPQPSRLVNDSVAWFLGDECQIMSWNNDEHVWQLLQRLWKFSFDLLGENNAAFVMLFRSDWSPVSKERSTLRVQWSLFCLAADWPAGWHFCLSRVEEPCQGMSQISNTHTSVWHTQTQNTDILCYKLSKELVITLYMQLKSVWNKKVELCVCAVNIRQITLYLM